MLFQAKGEVNPNATQSHIAYRFYLPPESSGGTLTIRLVYSPKRLEDREKEHELVMKSIAKYTPPSDRERVEAGWEAFAPLQNLITLSIDGPDGHRGAGHHHESERLVTLSADGATPGYVPGAIASGIWTVTLSLHAVVTDVCHYELDVQAEGGGV